MNADTDWITPDWAAPANVRALVTTRRGGFSQGAWAGMNLGLHVGDRADAVLCNRARLRERLPAEPAWLEQVHGVEVVEAERVKAPLRADASVAHRVGTVCAVMTADCLPVLLCDEAGSIVAAAHAGWRGLAAGVLEAVVARMAVRPATIIAWLGPAIGPQAFEVGDEVRAAFVAADAAAARAFVPAALPGKWFADLYLLARLRLARAGVVRVGGGQWCTYSDADRFYSYRRDGVTGRFASLVWRIA